MECFLLKEMHFRNILEVVKCRKSKLYTFIYFNEIFIFVCTANWTTRYSVTLYETFIKLLLAC